MKIHIYKKAMLFILCLVAVLSLSSCGGNVKNAYINDSIKSDIYSQEDIDSAMNVVINEFRGHFSGCTLKDICYAGDEQSSACKEWAKRNQADEVIVLLTTFETGSLGLAVGLNTNDVYPNYSFILVRSNGGSWKWVDSGYG